jgi:hypothetical protein
MVLLYAVIFWLRTLDPKRPAEIADVGSGQEVAGAPVGAKGSIACTVSRDIRLEEAPGSPLTGRVTFDGSGLSKCEIRLMRKWAGRSIVPPNES